MKLISHYAITHAVLTLFQSSFFLCDNAEVLLAEPLISFCFKCVNLTYSNILWFALAHQIWCLAFSEEYAHNEEIKTT